MVICHFIREADYGIGWLVDQCFQYIECIFLHTCRKVLAKMGSISYENLSMTTNHPKSQFLKKRPPQDIIRKILALAAAISLLFQQRRWAATFTHEPRRQEAYYQTKQQVWLKNSKLFDHFRLNLNRVITFSWMGSYFCHEFKLRPFGPCPSTNPTFNHP